MLRLRKAEAEAASYPCLLHLHVTLTTVQCGLEKDLDNIDLNLVRQLTTKRHTFLSNLPDY